MKLMGRKKKKMRKLRKQITRYCVRKGYLKLKRELSMINLY